MVAAARHVVASAACDGVLVGASVGVADGGGKPPFPNASWQPRRTNAEVSSNLGGVQPRQSWHPRGQRKLTDGRNRTPPSRPKS